MTDITKRPIKAEDLYTIEVIKGCEISPDGKNVIYAVSRVDKKTEKKFSNLWIVSTDGGTPHQFTFGDQTDVDAHWSPDGSQIAFISNRGKEPTKQQVYLIPSLGGEARPLTDFHGEIGSFAWSPNGKKLVVQLRKTDADVLEREKSDEKKTLGVVAYHFDRIFFKLDGTGYLPHERWHLWIVDAASGKARQITDHPMYDDQDPTWSADGKTIYYCSNHCADPDLEYEKNDLFAIPAAGGEPQRMDTSVGPKHHPSCSPDGKWVTYIARDGLACEWKNDHLWVIPADNATSARNLTAAWDIHFSSGTINDIGGSPAQMPPVWSPNSHTIYIQTSLKGDTPLQAYHLETGKLTTEISGPGVVGNYSISHDGTKLAYFYGTMQDPGQIVCMDLATHKHKVLTNLNASLLNSLDLGELEEVWFKGADQNDLQGWILKPPHFDPSKKYPAILEIHGGPLVQYGHFFMHEFYTFAAQGYVVFFCNPRGGQGYGEKHAAAIHQDWGSADFADLMVWTDLVSNLPYIDANRIGVTGGSYGGYMTNWIIGHTNRFKAAATQRSVSNLISMWGSSDFNWAFQETFDNKAPYESIGELWRMSPISHFANVKTPTLVLHSMQDHRCPIEQDEQVYVALKKLGVPTEFIVFPDESHGLSRGGRTDRRIARLNHILHWFDRYLKG